MIQITCHHVDKQRFEMSFSTKHRKTPYNNIKKQKDLGFPRSFQLKLLARFISSFLKKDLQYHLMQIHQDRHCR